MNIKEYKERSLKNFDEGNYDGAIADVSEAIRLEPDNHLSYQMRGKVYYHKNEFDAAIADFTKAIQLAPKDASSYFDRGGSYLFKNNKAMAISDLEMAVKLDPQNADYREALEEVKNNKTSSTTKNSFFSDLLGDIMEWDPTCDPAGQLKRRCLCFLIVFLICTIIFIYGADDWITGGIIGAIFGTIYGFGIVNLLSFIRKEWWNIRDSFSIRLKDYDYDIFAFIKQFLFVLFIMTILWRPIKLICYAVYLSPFIGIYQGIRLLIERVKLK